MLLVKFNIVIDVLSAEFSVNVSPTLCFTHPQLGGVAKGAFQFINAGINTVRDVVYKAELCNTNNSNL